MSYILNALRKSEQERRNGQVPTLQHGFPENQHLPQNRWSWFIIGLLVLNLAALAIFFWSGRQTEKTDTQSHAEPPATASSISPASQTVAPYRPTQQINKNEKPIVLPDEPSIADIVASRKADREDQPLRTTHTQDKPAKPGKADQTADITNKPDAIAAAPQLKKGKENTEPKHLATNTDNAQEDVVGTIKDEAPEIAATAETELIAVQKAAKQLSHVEPALPDMNDGRTAPARHPPSPRKTQRKPNDLPLLKELPYDFRRRVPELYINVYVYDEDPNHRYIMADMTRFTAGEYLAEGLELKEILADSLVVKYEGKTFRIKRP